MDSYRYAPVAESEIRLVTITEAEQGKLEATIQHVDLDPEDPLKYTALSYCWGNPTSRIDVPCDGKLLSITASLHEALCEIIHFSPNKTLWIDQICINQEDNADKSAQVKKMNLIYDKAETVLAWLGPASKSTALGVNFVKKVGDIALTTATDMFRWDDYVDNEEHSATRLERKEEYTQEKSHELGIPFDDLASWDAFSEFFDKPWYQRMWIVQEIIQARKAIVVCGPHSVSWEHVSAAARWFCYKAEAIHDRNSRNVDGMCLITQMVSIPWRAKIGSEYRPELLGQKMRPTCRWGLRDLLEGLRPRLATDPRDKVYGVLGISVQDGSFGEEGLTVDYSLSVKEIFTQATREIIKSDPTNDLNVIWSARQRCDEPGWPSWVPDWRQSTGYGCAWGIGKPFNTAPRVNGEHRFIPTDDPFALAVQGTTLGRVTYRSQYSHFGELFEHSRLREVYQDCMDRLRTYPTGEEVRQAFGLTIVGGHLTEALVETGTSVETYAENYMDFFDVTQISQAIPAERATRETLLRAFGEGLGFDKGWILAVLDAYCERRFFLTDTGYMGLAHHEVLEGDLIAVIVGLKWPCVLRPKTDNHDDGFEFIGDAYTHGMMDGEGVQDIPKDESEEGRGRYVGQKFLLK
ncbi:hypothetical protein ASPWEDRAFT_22358 [Aspergillus wentii DTO 134E9]|uniref:Heterokaryon incompatibility domain-containing protein n=1 Tax=Aspergillus wentii DTO 134E9 TaxID=1073089 RepID=A0A1L9RZ12_ASPWE|nr:uncharacterized protein ASPWEDRAFT_22358 [Aspergillus wentii DTO 134E9]OJJ40152.1 hypothetical protein ASPWEDRAFT_22358 [Aspergillus wentii DTO 134E9]